MLTPHCQLFFGFFFSFSFFFSQLFDKASAIGVDPEPFVVVLGENVIAIGVVVIVLVLFSFFLISRQSFLWSSLSEEFGVGLFPGLFCSSGNG